MRAMLFEAPRAAPYSPRLARVRWRQEPAPSPHRKSPGWVVLLALGSGIAVLGALVFALVGWPAHKGQDWRVQTVASALDAKPDQLDLSEWRTVPTISGSRLQATVTGVGVVEVDPRSRELTELIFEKALTKGPVGDIGFDAAGDTARSFAARHFPGFSTLQLHSTTSIDHVSFKEHRVLWQAQEGQAWLPSQVAVGVNAETGAVAYYWSQRVPLTVETTASITADQASRVATAAAGLGSKTKVETPELRVELTGRPTPTQRLVWVVPVRATGQLGPHVSRSVLVWVDALSGQGEIWART